MQALMSRYALPKPGFPEDGIRETVMQIGGAGLGSFYDLLARSTEEMPFEGTWAMRASGWIRTRTAARASSVRPVSHTGTESDYWRVGQKSVTRRGN